MDIKLKNKLLGNHKLWNLLERFVFLLFIAIFVFFILINSAISSIHSKKQYIYNAQHTLTETNSKLDIMNNFQNNKSDTSWIDFNSWISLCARPSNLSIYKNTNKLSILSEKSQEELNKFSKNFKLTSDNKDFSRLVKFIIIDKSKLTFITNDIDNMDFISKNIKAFSQEDGQFYTYVSSKGKWYNLSYDSSSAPAGNYDNSTIIHNPENFVEAYWFPQNYVYSREDNFVIEDLFNQANDNFMSYKNSLTQDIANRNREITIYKVFIVLYGIGIFVILLSLYHLGRKRILNGLKNNFIWKFFISIDNKFQNKSFIFKVISYVFLTLLTIFVAFISLFSFGILFVVFIPWAFVYLVFIFPKIIKALKYLDAIIKGADKITSGDLNHVIPEKGDKSLVSLAENINKINRGFKVSIEDQIKNEKLKSQLVANVSHDLKTPLTSIINYTDILLREDISQEEREEYLKILYRKGLKLKKLIDDLFQISKINSGKVDLNKENVDVIELLNQSIAEYSDTEIYNDKNLNFIIRPFRDSIEMPLDGNKMSRVFENIINNVLKYSLKNTRVYVDIEPLDGYGTINYNSPLNARNVVSDNSITNNECMSSENNSTIVTRNNSSIVNENNSSMVNGINSSMVNENNSSMVNRNNSSIVNENNSSMVAGIRIIFKNISAAALNFDRNEIFERFTRGDESRNSHIDGNGLGLAIAKSIVELHGGKMYVDFDGDLFKSIIELK
ncbi:sensor histidine kinase [Haloimpatiens lingqiaonensis]|uniref:sensor histidine kinase n=1 Tax=Haloimpatiens lingqiaonensis TaxID=1380675 RepID=UPI0010FDBAAA|nr:HAMP domain-containing sensor histidine kinase [Haloimpatiens lingqiaonensis]